MPRHTTRTATKTQTAVGVRTKIIAATVAVLTAGLAAYGFGFLPGLDEEASPARLTCEQMCVREYCREHEDGLVCDQLKYQNCLADCASARASSTDEGVLPSGDVPPSADSSRAPSCSLAVERVPDVGLEVHGAAADGETYYTLARYRVRASDGPVIISRLRVWTPYDSAVWRSVRVTAGSRSGNATLPAGSPAATDVALSSALVVYPGSDEYVDVQGSLNTIAPSADASRSGAVLALGLSAGDMSGVWGRGYEGHLNIEARCDASGTSVFMNGESSLGDPSFAYRSRLTLEQQPLSGNLETGDQALYRFTVRANPSGPVQLKKLVLHVYDTFTSPEAVLSRFRVRRGTSDLPLDSYQLLDSSGRDLRSAVWSAVPHDATVTLVFNEAATITSAGQTFGIWARVDGPLVTGDQIRVVGAIGGTPPFGGLGYLTDAGIAGISEGLLGPNVDTNTPADGRADGATNFVWSDMSASPHRDALGTVGGSRDWIAGYSPRGLTAQVLVR